MILCIRSLDRYIDKDIYLITERQKYITSHLLDFILFRNNLEGENIMLSCSTAEQEQAPSALLD